MITLFALRIKIILSILTQNKKNNTKKVGKWVSLCCAEVYKWVIKMDGVKFEFNDIILLYKKNDSERKWSVSL